MSAERPLEEARKRIATRNSRPSVASPVFEEETSTPELESASLLKIENDFLERIIPKPLGDIINDVYKTLEEKEGWLISSTWDFDYSTKDPNKIAQQLKWGKNPIKSAALSLQATIIKKGEIHKRVVFGPVSPIKEKGRDITYRVYLGITYNDKEKTVEWIMGDEDGPELKLNQPENKKSGYRLTAHDPYVKGSIKYSEVYMLTLAEELVTQIDLGRYKYEVRELPTVNLQ